MFENIAERLSEVTESVRLGEGDNAVDMAGQMGGYTHVPDDKLIHETRIDDLYRCLDPSVLKNGRSTIISKALLSRESSDKRSNSLRNYANLIPELQLSPKVDSRQRRKREFTPEDQKDCKYWSKRKRNNEAAKRSRYRRRMEEVLLEGRAVELFHENEKLKATLSAVQYGTVESRYNRSVENQNISAHIFHPFLNDHPPLMLPSRASSVGMQFRIANDVPDNGFTRSGFINTPCFSSVDQFEFKKGNGSHVLPKYKVELPGSIGILSGDPVNGHNGFSAEAIFHQSHGSATTATCVGHESNEVNSTSDNSGMSEYLCLNNGLGSRRNSTYSLEHLAHCKTVNVESMKQDPTSEAQTPIASSKVEIMMKDEVCKDIRTAKTTGVWTVFSLPHKLRYKLLKTFEEPVLMSRTPTTSAKENVNKALAQTSETTFTHSKTMAFPNASSTSLSVTPNYTKDDEHLNKQLTSLCAEVKHLKQLILAKSK